MLLLSCSWLPVRHGACDPYGSALNWGKSTLVKVSVSSAKLGKLYPCQSVCFQYYIGENLRVPLLKCMFPALNWGRSTLDKVSVSSAKLGEIYSC